MRFARPRRVGQVLSQIALAIGGLVYALMVLGVPWHHIKIRTGERFPCENCACGCSTADYCWQHCCCHTPAQRLAWAAREGVEPPDFVFARLRSESQLVCVTPPAKVANDTACESPAKGGCCCARKSQQKLQAAPACGEKLVQESPQRNDAQGARQIRVLAWRALTCQGSSTWWAAAAPLPPASSTSGGRYLVLVDWLGPVISETCAADAEPPTSPPPQILCLV